MPPRPTKPLLQTERIELAPMSWDDYPDLCILDGDPEVMRYLDRPRSPEQVRAKMQGWMAPAADERGFGFWVGRERSTFLGWWLLEEMGPGIGEIGWRMLPAAWGRGLASEGARALLEHAFTTLDLDLVYAETMAVNVRSRAVMERLGMRHTRSWVGEWSDPLPGAEEGEVRYDLTAEDWRAR